MLTCHTPVCLDTYMGINAATIGNNTITVGDIVTVNQNQAFALGLAGDKYIVHYVSDDGKTIYVRDAGLPTYGVKREIQCFTLRANGKYVAKGKKSDTWNASYLT